MALSRMVMLTIMTTAKTLAALLTDEFTPQIQAELKKRPLIKEALVELQSCLNAILESSVA